jgi:hypothetical protein
MRSPAETELTQRRCFVGGAAEIVLCNYASPKDTGQPLGVREKSNPLIATRQLALGGQESLGLL